MSIDRRSFLAASAAALTVSGDAFAQPGEPALRPEAFGARGDGATNDSTAFAALSARISAMGGGTVALGAGKTYLVGRQRPDTETAFVGDPILQFAGLTRPLTIIGNGARLRATPGLRFGAFDAARDAPVHRAQPFYDRRAIAVPYQAMILVRGAGAPVTIRDVELDGNVAAMRLGGRWGDVGWQIPGSGLALYDNHAEELIDNVLSHHHPLDGALVDGEANRTAPSQFTRLLCRYNGRQGLSIVGGRGYDFTDCEFAHSGRSRLTSAPGAGVDIEPEGNKRVRDLSFARCKFIDNAGPGLLAEIGDAADARFSDCLFVGTTAWAAWPRKPGLSFEGCTFAGASANAFPSADPSLATQFHDCRFIDDPALSPTGKLYLSGAEGGPIVDLGQSDNVLFDQCRFELAHGGVLPWCWRATFRDCAMRQASRKTAYTKGRYLGRTVIDGPVDLYGSMILGTVILNGRPVPHGPVGSDVKPW